MSRIAYLVTLRVIVPSGQPDEVPTPFEESFYDSCSGTVHVMQARRETPAVNYGGPK